MKTPFFKTLLIAGATLSPWILNAAEPPNRGAAEVNLGAANAANSAAQPTAAPSQAAGSRGDGVNKNDSRPIWNGELFQKLDTDSNGSVSREEYDRYAAANADKDKGKDNDRAESRRERRERRAEKERTESSDKVKATEPATSRNREANEGTTRVDASKPTNSGSTTDGTSGSGSGTSSLDASGSKAGRDPQNPNITR